MNYFVIFSNELPISDLDLVEGLNLELFINKMENPYNGPSALLVQVETNKWYTGPGGHP